MGMKLKFLALHKAPESYSFSGETVTAFFQNNSETFDLTDFEGEFESCETDTILLKGQYVIDNIERTEDELYVTLAQAPPVTKITYKTELGLIHLSPTDNEPESYISKVEHREGHWIESDWIDSEDYNPETLYIKEVE